MMGRGEPRLIFFETDLLGSIYWVSPFHSIHTIDRHLYLREGSEKLLREFNSSHLLERYILGFQYCLLVTFLLEKRKSYYRLDRSLTPVPWHFVSLSNFPSLSQVYLPNGPKEHSILQWKLKIFHNSENRRGTAKEDLHLPALASRLLVKSSHPLF